MQILKKNVNFVFLTKIFLFFLIGFSAFFITIQMIKVNDTFTEKKELDFSKKETPNPKEILNKDIEQKIIGDSKKDGFEEYLIWEDRSLSDPQIVNYSIRYNEKFKIVIIDILQKPFSEWREQAEKTFLEKTTLSKKEACALKINLGTTISVDYDLSGKNLGLSFCENSL